MDGTVASARLLSLTIERFKSYKEATTIELSPLTVILGRNNSGKSSIIQALLLLMW
jgi:predicted ATPase